MSHSVPLDQITMHRVTADDPMLQKRIPVLGIQQGDVHKTILPNKRKDMATVAQNFQAAVASKKVEIWRLESPVPAGGAIFVSPLYKNEEAGYQLDDIVVRQGLRGHGLGSAMVQFSAALAKSNGLKFVAWECEEDNTAQKMYRQVGAKPRDTVKPFRLGKDILTALPSNPNDKANLRLFKENKFTVSSRFSLFRTGTYGIEGYDIDPTQKSFGLQIEDVDIATAEQGRAALVTLLSAFRDHDEIDFVDIVIPNDSAKHLELIKSFDAEQNTYSGNPAYLWELSGEAFEQAAKIGQQIKIV